MRAMNYEVWLRKFRPVGTPKEGARSGFDGKMFETYGTDLETIHDLADREPNRVWTLVDCGGPLYISPGLHRVNRLGYFMTDVPWDNSSRDVRA